MNKILSLLLVATVCIFFYSCEKEREAPMACIDTGTAEFKAGRTIYFMNCSQNYNYTKWSVTDEMNNVLFTEVTDTLKHFQYSFNPGIFNVKLKVGYPEATESEITQTITVTP